MKSNKSLYMKENEKTGMNNYANLSSLMKDIDIFQNNYVIDSAAFQN